jgi:hypothetical protein
MAGVFYGVESIPKPWRAKLAMKELVLSFADRLFMQRKQIGGINFLKAMKLLPRKVAKEAG